MSATDDKREALAERAEERGQGICRTCLLPIWNEGGTIGGRKRAEGWSDRIERGGDSLVCFKAADYRHVPLVGREAAIYDTALRRRGSITDAVVEAAAQRFWLAGHPCEAWPPTNDEPEFLADRYRFAARAALVAAERAR